MESGRREREEEKHKERKKWGREERKEIPRSRTPDAVSAADRARRADKTVPTYNNILGIRGFSDGGRVPDGLCQFESLSWFTRLAYREATWTHVRRTLTG